MFTIYGIDGTNGVVDNGIVWSTIIISLAISIAFYVLRGIGLFVMAKKQNVKYAWLAFIPCTWVYVACKIIGDARFFGRTVNKLALWFTIIFAVCEVLMLVYDFIIWFPVVGNFLAGNELCLVIGAEENWISDLTVIWEGFPIFGGDTFVNPYGSASRVIYLILNIVDIVSSILSLGTIIITIWIYINLFKKYWPRHFILAAVLSWMGIFAPLVFGLQLLVNLFEFLHIKGCESAYIGSRVGSRVSAVEEENTLYEPFGFVVFLFLCAPLQLSRQRGVPIGYFRREFEYRVALIEFPGVVPCRSCDRYADVLCFEADEP